MESERERARAAPPAPPLFFLTHPPTPSLSTTTTSNLPFVRDNFSAVVLGIVAVSLLPLAVESWLAKRDAAGGGAAKGA